MKRSGKFPKRYLVYLFAVVYLFCDLYWLKGPLYQRVEYRAGAGARAQRAVEQGRWVATVNTHPLTRAQLDLATAIYIYRRGESPDEMSPVAMRTTRRAVMQQLVNDELVRQYALAEQFTPDPQAVDRRLAAFEDQFPNESAMDERLAAQGLSRQQVGDLLRQHVAQQLWLEKRISPALQVDGREARDWYENNRENPEAEGFTVPDIVRARHIFISTVEDDGEQRKMLIDEIHRQLVEEKRPFAELARVHSEDEHSKKKGGDLGWFGRHRMPEDFSERVFSLRSGETSPPFRTSLGWHIVELTARKAARDLSFEEMKPEIVTWLENNKRREVLGIFLLKLRKAANIVIYPQNF